MTIPHPGDGGYICTGADYHDVNCGGNCGIQRPDEPKAAPKWTWSEDESGRSRRVLEGNRGPDQSDLIVSEFEGNDLYDLIPSMCDALNNASEPSQETPDALPDYPTVDDILKIDSRHTSHQMCGGCREMERLAKAHGEMPSLALCLVCAYVKKPGIYSATLRAAVCVECRDKAQAPAGMVLVSRERLDELTRERDEARNCLLDPDASKRHVTVTAWRDLQAERNHFAETAIALRESLAASEAALEAADEAVRRASWFVDGHSWPGPFMTEATSAGQAFERYRAARSRTGSGR